MTTPSTSGNNTSNAATAAAATARINEENVSASCGISNGETLNPIEKEYKRKNECHEWNRFYQEIRENSDREANEKNFVTTESEKPQNRCLNRYRDVNPYDHSRIILRRGNVDYINANLVKMERADRKYILTQGPLNDTVGHFWLMIFEQQSKAILMLNKLLEKKQVKCHKYWPDRPGVENALKLSDVKLQVEYLKSEEYKNFIRRWFKLTDLVSNESREIIQFHYITWPDFGIPSSPVAFLQFLKQVRDSGALDPAVGPAVVHCSAGIGRSGTFCLVDCCLVLIEKEGENNVSVQNVLFELRRYRMGLIQTADQLFFSYQAIIEGMRLFKDPNFHEYYERPLKYEETNSSSSNDQINLDEIPPPLPPRIQSLTLSSSTTLLDNCKAIIMQNDLISRDADSNNDQQHQHQYQLNASSKDALNNFINKEKSMDNNCILNRSLPPLPTHQQDYLNQLIESDSDKNEYLDDDDDDDDDDDGDDVEDDDDNVDDEDAVGNDEQILDNNSDYDDDEEQHKQHQTSNESDLEPGGDLTNYSNIPKAKQNENDVTMATAVTNSIPSNRTSSNNQNKLHKRRTRQEQQNLLEEKVNAIKRRKRETDENNKNYARKRRTFLVYLTAGLVVGMICVYAYTKISHSN